MGAEGQAQPVGSTSLDTLNTRVVPIVFVPGVMGTRLSISGTAFNWDPDDLAEMAGWVKGTRRQIMDRLSINTNATPAEDLDANSNLGQIADVDPLGDIKKRPRLKEIATDKLPKNTNSRAFPGQIVKFYKDRGFGQAVWSFYGNALMDLEEQLNPGSHAGEIHPLYVCGYDWRQSNAVSGARLKTRIKEILKEQPLAKKVIIVSHSMGGLVTRSALAQGAEPDILGVVHTVMPADGAVVAYRRFFSGARREVEENKEKINQILGDNRIDYILTQSVLRGPVELLPTNSYPEVFFTFTDNTTNKDRPNIFDDYLGHAAPGIVFKEGEEFDPGRFSITLKVTAADVRNMETAIREAGKFALTISNRFHPKTFLVIGVEVRTDIEVDFRKGPVTPDGKGTEKISIKRDVGDGTVPEPSARFAACKPLGKAEIKHAIHATCFDAPDFTPTVLKNIRKLLET